VQVVDARFPLASAVEHVTCVAPIGNVNPEAGRHVTATAPSTMSNAVASELMLTLPRSSARMLRCRPSWRTMAAWYRRR
jgi:hypothetical protein